MLNQQKSLNLGHNNRWVQKKEGQKGKIYDGNIKNPSRQIEKQIFEIKNLLSRKGIKTWVEGTMVFAHPEAQVFFDNPKNFKILKTDEIEALFRGKRAVFNSKTIESIANLISVRYREGRRADSSRFLS